MHALLRSFLIAAAALSTGIAVAEDCPPADHSPMCEDARAQAIYERADGELNAAYQSLLKRMSKPSEAELDYPALKTSFVQAQRQWLRFRDNECAAWYVINQAGAQRNADTLACLTERTQDRNRQLQAWSAALP